MKAKEYEIFEKGRSNKVGRGKEALESPPARKLPMCFKCFSLVQRGVAHVHDKQNKRENLANFVRTSSGDTKGNVVSKVLKDLCSESNPGTSGSLSLATGGKPLPVKIGKATRSLKRPKFSLEHLKRLQTSINLSDRQTL